MSFDSSTVAPKFQFLCGQADVSPSLSRNGLLSLRIADSRLVRFFMGENYARAEKAMEAPALGEKFPCEEVSSKS